jgi:catechol 2,3-dioxygenase-like lactoylglutathione lyase family enzyme
MSNTFRVSRDVIIRSKDLAETSHFYETVLQLPIVARSASLICFDAGAFRLYLEAGAPHGPVFEFFVPDFAAAKQELLRAGCTVIEEHSAVPRCYIGDPHGLVFNIAQR